MHIKQTQVKTKELSKGKDKTKGVNQDFLPQGTDVEVIFFNYMVGVTSLFGIHLIRRTPEHWKEKGIEM